MMHILAYMTAVMYAILFDHLINLEYVSLWESTCIFNEIREKDSHIVVWHSLIVPEQGSFFGIL